MRSRAATFSWLRWAITRADGMGFQSVRRAAAELVPEPGLLHVVLPMAHLQPVRELRNAEPAPEVDAALRR